MICCGSLVQGQGAGRDLWVSRLLQLTVPSGLARSWCLTWVTESARPCLFLAHSHFHVPGGPSTSIWQIAASSPTQSPPTGPRSFPRSRRPLSRGRSFPAPLITAPAAPHAPSRACPSSLAHLPAGGPASSLHSPPTQLPLACDSAHGGSAWGVLLPPPALALLSSSSF